MVALVLGPILRAGAAGQVSVWVETSDPCTVSVLGHDRHTWAVAGHHYALVDLDDVPLGRPVQYEVALDGRVAWPDAALGLPPSSFVLWGEGQPLRIAAGSCRQQAPLRTHPKGSEPADDPEGMGPDALAALSAAVQDGRCPTPHLLLLTGDQVYADEQHPSVENALRTRRGGPPAEGWPDVTSFEEYTWLYQKTWSHPLIRWLLSSVPSLMIFDDHDVIDDWNISEAWTADMAREPWWADRLCAAHMSYWVYQHIGNMTVAERRDDGLYRAVTEGVDGEQSLATFASEVGSGTTERLDHTWSYTRRFGPLSLAVLDARNGRVLQPDRRSMLSPRDWGLAEEVVRGADGHLLLVSSVPWILPHGIHRLERLTSRLASHRGPVRWVAERLRRGVDLEHWPAFGDSFERLADLLVSRADGAAPPTSQIVLSGDVHFSYLAELRQSNKTAAIQVVSSPLRQANPPHELVALRAAMSRPFDWLARAGLRLTRRDPVETPFTITDGVWFDNNVAWLEYDDSGLTVRLNRAYVDHELGRPVLEPLVERRI